ncbi:putative leader peptide [Streptomyces sp.]|jgi:hypothetical protein
MASVTAQAAGLTRRMAVDLMRVTSALCRA